MTTTKLILAALTAAISTLAVNAQQPYDPFGGIGHHHYHHGATIIGPDGPTFIPPHYGNDGYTIIAPDGPSFVSPRSPNGGYTIITPNGPIFINPNP